MNFRRLYGLPLFAAFAIMLGVFSASSGLANRMVLGEYFTNASVDEFVNNNSQINSYFTTNLTKVIPIYYHTEVYTQINSNYIDLLARTDATNINERFFYYFDQTNSYYFAANGKYVTNTMTSTAFQSQVNTASKMAASTYTINVALDLTNDSAKATVDVSSTAAVANKKFFVILCEAYHHTDGAYGYGGEKDFYFIARKFMVPDGSVNLNLAANAVYHRSYTVGISPDWYPDMLYAVAFVQDSVTKEVYQVGTSTMPTMSGVTTRPRLHTTIDQAAIYQIMKRNETQTKDVIIKNANSVDMTARVALGGTLAQGWTASVDQNLVTIPAGGSKTVKVTLNTNYKPGYAELDVYTYPINLENAFPVTTAYAMYFETENIDMALFTGGAGSDLPYNDLYNVAAIEAHSYDIDTVSAELPINDATMNHFPTDNFKFAFFYFDQGSNSLSSGDFASNTRDIIKNMFDAGRKVWVVSTADVILGLRSTADEEAKSFIADYIGIDSVSTDEGYTYYSKVDQSTGYTVFTPFAIKGVENDIIGNGMDVTVSQNTADWNAATELVVPLKVRSGSTAIPFMFYPDQDAAVVPYVGVRKMNELKGKFVFSTLGSEGMSTTDYREDFLTRILDWLDPLSQGGGKITSSETSLTFNSAILNQSMTRDITLSNTGSDKFTISNIELTDVDKKFFTFTPAFTQSIVLQPEETKTYTITFLSADDNHAADYVASFVVTSDAKNTKVLTIPMLANITGSVDGAGIKTNADNNVLDFGTFEAKKEVSRVLNIQNNGTQNLTITSIQFPEDQDTRGYFTLPSMTFPKTIQPTDNPLQYTIKFKNPDMNSEYDAVLHIKSNAVNGADLAVTLKTKTLATDVKESVTEDGLFEMTANPAQVVDNSVIKMKLNGDSPKHVKISVYDVTGRKVAELFNAVMNPGSEETSINAADLSSGKYFILADVESRSAMVSVVVTK